MRLALLFVLSVIAFTANASAGSAEERYDGPIIDMHVHALRLGDFGGPMTVCTNEQDMHFPGLDPSKPINVQRTSVCARPLPSAQTNEQLLNETVAMFERYNIVLAVTDGTFDELARWRAASPDRIVPAIDFHDMGLPPLGDLRAAYRDGAFRVFAEVSPQYAGKLATDEALDRYFALAEELDIPVGFHLGEGPPGGPHIAGYESYRAAATSPLQLEDVLIKYPDLRIYVMHYGSPLVEDMIALLYSHPQVYVDVAQNNWGTPRAHFYRQLKMLIDAGFQKRIMFGSDQMIWPETIRIAIDTIQEAEFLTPEQTRDIFYGNAARFLRLDQKIIDRHHGR